MRYAVSAAFLLGAWAAVAGPATASNEVSIDWAGGLASDAIGEAQGTLLSGALAAANAGDWERATEIVRQIGDPVASDIVLWSRLRHGVGRWDEYRAFLATHREWPGLDILRRAGERLIPPDLAPADVGRYFLAGAPQTGTGALRLADAFAATGRTEAAEAEILRAWREIPMSAAERDAIRAGWDELVSEYHVDRLDMLLWQGHTLEAEAMLPLVGPDWQALARARIATRRDAEGLQSLIWSVPASLRDHPGLAYERYLYRVSKGRWDEAENYLFEKSASHDVLGRPDMWMERRANLARQALRRGEVERAYALASQSWGSAGGEYADAEWLAGFIALEHKDDPERAVAHFQRFRAVVFTPISLGRAGYWLGLAFERAGDPAQAEQAYQLGARYQTSFYGQLAAERAGLPADETLAGAAAATEITDPAVLRSSVIRAGWYFVAAGYESRGAQFLQHASEKQPASRRAQIAQMAIDRGYVHIGLRIAKDAAAEGIVLPEQYYPLHPIAEVEWKVPAELALAVARQESEMNPAAESHAGARGLMQLMPGTARQMAERVGLPYRESRLISDPAYNARLGTEYLASMLSYYDGSYMLAAAAYNAGPGRVDQWLEEFGDPRDPEVDPVTWVESIPFSETRNYVMRVLEGLHVYRARLNGTAAPVRLAADMRAAG
jgi:soluble lytic murein transglycosylase